jgi:hypothetical protein
MGKLKEGTKHEGDRPVQKVLANRRTQADHNAATVTHNENPSPVMAFVGAGSADACRTSAIERWVKTRSRVLT